MPIGRPRTFDLTLTSLERTQLTEWAHSRSLPHALVQRAQTILLSAEGLANTEVAGRVGLSHPMVGHWATGPLGHWATGVGGFSSIG
jgi:DNA-binding NarL/FixJ family response regulator